MVSGAPLPERFKRKIKNFPLLLALSSFVIGGCADDGFRRHSFAPAASAWVDTTPYHEVRTGDAEFGSYGYERDFYERPSTSALAMAGAGASDPVMDVIRAAVAEQRMGVRHALSGQSVPESSCSIGDRFDSNMLIAYDFDDNQSRLGLNLSYAGIGFSDASFSGPNSGGRDFLGVMVQFRYKFEPVKSHSERCRYKSHWQGIVGSVYNEFFARDSDTVWKALEDQGLDVWNR